MRYLVMYATGDIETSFRLTNEDYDKIQNEEIDLIYDTRSNKELVATDEGPRWVSVKCRRFAFRTPNEERFVPAAGPCRHFIQSP